MNRRLADMADTSYTPYVSTTGKKMVSLTTVGDSRVTGKLPLPTS